MAQMCPKCSRDNYDVAQTCNVCGEALRGLLGQNTVLESRYRTLRVLGCGGMGAVYLAEDQRIPGRQVAIKENLNISAQAQSQFQAEVDLMVNLRHPGLPAISDQFIGGNGRQYLVMDYIAGRILEDLIDQQGALPEDEVRKLASQLLDVLAYLHNNQVIHRDVKPANIKLAPDSKLVLVDFGIAKRHATGSITQSWAKGMGSPGFAPLEQYYGGTDPRSDLYSVGAVMYFLLTGQVPPQATDLASGTPLPPPRRLQPALSADIQQIVFKAMALQADQRYQSAAEMRQALTAASAKRSASPTVVANPSLPAPVVRRSFSAGAGRWAIAAGLIALFGFLLVWFTADDPADGPAVASATVAPASIAGPEVATATATANSLAGATRIPEGEITLFPTPTRRPPTQTPIPATPTPRPPTITPTRRSPTPIPTPYAVVSANTLNVRSGPGTEYDRIAQVNKGERLLVTGRNRACDWLQTRLPGGRIGWIAAELAALNVSPCDPPLVPDPPAPAPTPTSPPILASNVSQFSNSQGANGWWYQVEEGRNSGRFVDFPVFAPYGSPSRNCWQTPQEGHVRICEGGEVHPGGTGRIAYRWQSNATRTMRVQVHAHKIDTSCGNNDGVWIGVFQVPQGQPPNKVGDFSLSGLNNKDKPANTYTYSVPVNVNDAIMVMVDVARGPACDMTRLYIDIN